MSSFYQKTHKNVTSPQKTKMKVEVDCACEFFSRMLESKSLPSQFVKPFKRRLQELLVNRFQNHWHPSNPNKGSAYRCIRINKKMDPVVREAAKVTGLSDISHYLPAEFTMWIDPSDVSYRFGEDGSISSCPLDFVNCSVWSTSSTTHTNTTTKVQAVSSATTSSSKYYHAKSMYGGLSNYRPLPVPVQV